jgi:hypothetical protein
VAAPPLHAAPAPAQDAEPAPIPLSAVDESLEVVPGYAQGFATAPSPPETGRAADEPPPIPLVAVDDEEFELDNAYRTPNTYDEGPGLRTAESAAVEARWRAEEPDVVEAEAESLEVEPDAPEPVVPEPEMIDEEFEVQAAPPASRPVVTFRTIVPEEAEEAGPAVTVPPPAAALPPWPVAVPAAVPAEPTFEPPTAFPSPPPVPPRSPEPELASPTLAELYFDQGFMDKAIEVYKRLLEREPHNARLSSRLAEIEGVHRHLSAPGGVPAGPAESRREEIERTIARLQGLRTALVRRS